MTLDSIITYVNNLSSEARADIAEGKWDEVMTDDLYGAVGAETPQEMQAAREAAESLVK